MRTWNRLEAGLIAMVLVLFLYTPAQPSKTEETEYRFRAVEIISTVAEWLGLGES